jgi:hypothetical protein
VPWAIEASGNHPNIVMTLRYCEYGVGFSGSILLKGGDILEQVQASAEDVHPEDEFDKYF